MRQIFISALGLALVASVPALAQSSQTGQSSSSKGQGAATQSSTQIHAMSQDNLRKQLQQAGFKNIEILDAAYLVQAQTSDGNSVFMTINPPAMSGSSSASGNASGSGASNGSSASGGQNQSGSNKQ